MAASPPGSATRALLEAAEAGWRAAGKGTDAAPPPAVGTTVDVPSASDAALQTGITVEQPHVMPSADGGTTKRLRSEGEGSTPAGVPVADYEEGLAEEGAPPAAKKARATV